MANVTVAGASFTDVPAVSLPTTGGGTSTFYEADFKTVTMNLTDVSSSADDTRVENGSSFFTKLAPIPNNYVISSITVTMGGIDVTSQVFQPDEGGGGGSSLGTKNITQNGTYNAVSDGYDGYSQVTVNVSGGITPTGNINISQAGVTDVTNYATATVPSAVPFLGYTSGEYVTIGNQRKWRGNFFVEVNTAEGDTEGWLPDGFHEDYTLVKNAVPANTTITPTTSEQTIGAEGSVLESAVTVAAMPSGTAGTPTATKGAVSNHSVSVTPSVTNTTGYITGSTKTGTAVTVSASELVSGSQTITSNQTVDVTNLASVTVAVPFSTIYSGSSAPSSSQGVNGDIYIQTS